MEPVTPGRMRAGDADRDATLGILREAHALGRLDLGEFEQRQELALAARFHDDLRALTADLPESGGSAGTSGPSHLRLAESGRPSGAVVPGSRLALSNLAVMSGKDVQAEPGVAEVRTFSFWGGNNIHLDQVMGPGVTVTLHLTSIMGGCTVHVPEGVRIVDESFGLMGGNSIGAKALGDGSRGTVVLRGLQFWGGNIVKRSERG